MSDAILVYRFYDAPEELRNLSGHGGDEDWLAVLPPHIADDYIPWIEGRGFGACDTSWHDHPTWEGAKVAIGAHA